MKSVEFITEDIAPDLIQFMTKVRQDCQPYLSQVDEPLTNNALHSRHLPTDRDEQAQLHEILKDEK